MTSGEQSFQRAGYDRGGQPIGWLSTGIVQGSVSRILICCKGDWSTRLQKNPQRLGWGSWRNVLYYILGLHSKCQGLCDWSYTSVFKYYFSNTWTGLGCSRVSLCSLEVEIELFPYRIVLEASMRFKWGISTYTCWYIYYNRWSGTQAPGTDL